MISFLHQKIDEKAIISEKVSNSFTVTKYRQYP